LRLVDAFGERIDGQDAAGWGVFVVGQELDAGMRHFPAEALQLRLAGHQNTPADGQFFAHPGLIEPDAAEVARALLEQHAEHRLSRRRVSQIDLVDDADHARQAFFFELVDLAQLAHVLISSREEEQQVRGVMQVEPGEQLGALRPDAFQELDRRGELLSRRFLRARGHGGILGRSEW